MLIEIN